MSMEIHCFFVIPGTLNTGTGVGFCVTGAIHIPLLQLVTVWLNIQSTCLTSELH